MHHATRRWSRAHPQPIHAISKRKELGRDVLQSLATERSGGVHVDHCGLLLALSLLVQAGEQLRPLVSGGGATCLMDWRCRLRHPVGGGSHWPNQLRGGNRPLHHHALPRSPLFVTWDVRWTQTGQVLTTRQMPSRRPSTRLACGLSMSILAIKPTRPITTLSLLPGEAAVRSSFKVACAVKAATAAFAASVRAAMSQRQYCTQAHTSNNARQTLCNTQGHTHVQSTLGSQKIQRHATSAV